MRSGIATCLLLAWLAAPAAAEDFRGGIRGTITGRWGPRRRRGLGGRQMRGTYQYQDGFPLT